MAKEIGNWGQPKRAAGTQAAPRTDARAVIERLLEPGETLLWHANGRGPHWDGNNIFSVVFMASFIPASIFMLTRGALNGQTGGWMLGWAISLFSVVSVVMVVGIFYAIASPSLDCYGLTDRRVITVRRFWRRRIRSYTATNIQNLRVRSGATGDIGFWKQDTGLINRAWEIVGIDNPMDVAERIKATLGITLPIEDVSMKSHIPPTGPRPS